MKLITTVILWTLLAVISSACGSQSAEKSERSAHSENSEVWENSFELLNKCLPVFEMIEKKKHFNFLKEKYHELYMQAQDKKFQLRYLEHSCGVNVDQACQNEIDITGEDSDESREKCRLDEEKIDPRTTIYFFVPYYGPELTCTDDLVKSATSHIEYAIEKLKKQIDLLNKQIAVVKASCKEKESKGSTSSSIGGGTSFN